MAEKDIELGNFHVCMALEHIHRFGWLRPQEIGRYIWPRSPRAFMYGIRLADRLKKEKYVIPRTLPSHFGTALFLSKSGAELLREKQFFEAKTGKDVGSINSSNKWTPRATWKHELLTSSTMILLREKWLEHFDEFMTEADFESRIHNSVKIPDGIIFLKNLAFWIEVENTKKSGRNMRDMVDSAINLLTNGISICGKNISNVIFVYPKISLDYRNYEIDHKKALIHALKEQLLSHRTIDVIFVEVTQKSGAAVDASITKETIQGESILSDLVKDLQDSAKEAWLYADEWDHTYDQEEFPIPIRDHCAVIEKSVLGKYNWQIYPYENSSLEKSEEFFSQDYADTSDQAWNAIAAAIRDEFSRRRNLRRRY